MTGRRQPEPERKIMTDSEHDPKAPDPKTGRAQEIGLGLLFTVTGGLIVAFAVLCWRNDAHVLSPLAALGAILLGLVLAAMGIAALVRAARSHEDGRKT
jgi:hypothetical protein